MRTITVLAAVLIAGAGRVYAASGAGGGDVNRDVVDDANAALGHANNALNAANALLNQLAQGNSGQTPAAPPVQHPQPGYTDAVGCFDAAYSGTSLSREEAMRLCAGAMDSGPAVCFMQAYSGTSLTKDEALQMCASGHQHKELKPGAAAGKARQEGSNFRRAGYREIAALKAVIERGLPGACALRKTEILGENLFITVADTNNGTVMPLKLAFFDVFYSSPAGSDLQVSSEWSGSQLYAVEFPFGLWGNASRDLSLKVRDGKVSELQIYQEEKTLTGGTKKSSVVCAR